MLALLAFLTMFVIIFLLLTNRSSPVVVLILVPLISAILLGISPGEIGGFFKDGMGRVTQVAAMFIFAITFFGILQDTGLFRPLINGLVRLTRGNVTAVLIGTALAGVLAHLDGAGATTFLLTIPTLLPLYKRLNISRYLMLLLLATGAGITNMLPWAGPLGRAAAVTGLDVTELWHPLIPIQAIGIVMLVIMAFWFSLREKRKIANGQAVILIAENEDINASDLSDYERSLLRPHLIWVNTALFVAVLVLLVSGIMAAPFIFMIGLSLLLVINYPRAADQMELIRKHAPSALLMGIIIFAAGSFLGIMDGTGMLKALAETFVRILPETMIPMLHIMLGIFGVPMELILSTDAYYFGLLPIVIEIVTPVGVSAPEVVHALVIGNIVGTFISPFSPALWLALGLANADMGKHIRYSVFVLWGFSLILMGFAWLLGLF
ncbi:CitMHS family transporter [Pseudochrobactrum sp. MP213Fo]|uniref:CitMHS family transporter n=1 Tax=Pseudochrobactrum sp. MP213Fo TaxID=3022250 RepID=UPI003BA0F852